MSFITVQNTGLYLPLVCAPTNFHNSLATAMSRATLLPLHSLFPLSLIATILLVSFIYAEPTVSLSPSLTGTESRSEQGNTTTPVRLTDQLSQTNGWKLPLLTESVHTDTTTVAWWRFDEGTGDTLHDLSTYHHDGQIRNATWTQGRVGHGLQFDGHSSYVVLPNHAVLNPVDAFTLEAWFMLDTLQFDPTIPPDVRQAVILGNLGPYPFGGGYQIYIWDGGALQFDYRTGSPISRFSGLTQIPTAHEFHHVAVVYEQVIDLKSPTGHLSIIKTYLDGLLTDSVAYPEGIQYTATHAFYIGTNIDGRAVGSFGVREFPGIIDEIRISHGALVPSQFNLSPPPSANDIAAWWRFDEGSGTVLHDATENHNDGQIHGAAWTSGRVGGGLHFDGMTSYVSLPNAASLQLHEQFTLEAWISLDTLVFPSTSFDPGFAIILSNLGAYPSGGGYQLALRNNDGFRYEERGQGGITHVSGFAPMTVSRTFIHVAAVYRREPDVLLPGDSITVLKTYVNGVLVDSSQFAEPIQYTLAPTFFIGTNTDGVYHGGIREFPGVIDEIRICRVALEPSSFNLSPPPPFPPLSPPTTSEPTDNLKPRGFQLHQNYPNPFNPQTTIELELAKPSVVTLRVYNVLGQEITRLIDRKLLEEGYHEVLFDAAVMSSGIYMYSLQAVDAQTGKISFQKVRKMMLIK